MIFVTRIEQTETPDALEAQRKWVKGIPNIVVREICRQCLEKSSHPVWSESENYLHANIKFFLHLYKVHAFATVLYPFLYTALLF